MNPSHRAFACYCGGIISYEPISEFKYKVQTSQELLGSDTATLYEASFQPQVKLKTSFAELFDLKITASYPSVITEFKIPNNQLKTVISVILKSDIWVEPLPKVPLETRNIFQEVIIKLQKQPNGFISGKTLSRVSNIIFIQVSPAKTYTKIKVSFRTIGNEYALSILAKNNTGNVKVLTTQQGIVNDCGRRIYVKDHARAVELDWIKNQKAFCGFTFAENSVRFKKLTAQKQQQTEEK